jgi:hypothetical protein
MMVPSKRCHRSIQLQGCRSSRSHHGMMTIKSHGALEEEPPINDGALEEVPPINTATAYEQRMQACGRGHWY